MFNPGLYSILIVSLNPAFVRKNKQRLIKKGFNVYYFDSVKRYEDFIIYENLKVDYYILDVNYFEFHQLLSDHYIPGVILEVNIDVDLDKFLRGKLSVDNYSIHSNDLGIKYCSNNKSTYERFYSSFKIKYNHFKKEFNDSIAERDYFQARKLVHGLRGISLNVGSRQLYNYCSFVDNYLKVKIDRKAKRINYKKIEEEVNRIFYILNYLIEK